jgi:hypothetical protein
MSSARSDGPTDMTQRDPALDPFDALIGTWGPPRRRTRCSTPSCRVTSPSSGSRAATSSSRLPQPPRVVPRRDERHRRPRGRWWPWRTSTRAARAGRTASRSTTPCSHLAQRPALAVLRHAGARHLRGPMAARRTPGDWQDDLKATCRRRLVFAAVEFPRARPPRVLVPRLGLGCKHHSAGGTCSVTGGGRCFAAQKKRLLIRVGRT